MKFREFIEVIEQHGFGLTRTDGSHRRYEGVVNRRIELITVAYHRASDDILPKTLASMIRQSGLPKKTFRQ